jgi:hypothetical protein
MSIKKTEHSQKPCSIKVVIHLNTCRSSLLPMPLCTFRGRSILAIQWHKAAADQVLCSNWMQVCYDFNDTNKTNHSHNANTYTYTKSFFKLDLQSGRLGSKCYLLIFVTCLPVLFFQPVLILPLSCYEWLSFTRSYSSERYLIKSIPK